MANYVVKHKCSWGETGAVVKVEGELTARQKLMLKPLVASPAEIESTEALKAENEALKAEIESLKKEPELNLEPATPTKPASKK